MALAAPAIEINGFTQREIFILDAESRPLMVGYGVFDPNGELLASFTPLQAELADEVLKRHAWSRPVSQLAS